MRAIAAIAAFLLFSVLAPTAHAELPFTQTSYADEIPTLKSVVGHAPGEEITTPRQALDYLDRLEDAAPEMVKVIPYAESWEGRQLVYVVISSPRNMENLEKIKADLARLADGRSVAEPDRTRMVAELPAVTWLAYGVHGNEISSTDAALALAYHLVAARGDPQVETILKESILVIDPMQNPDGRARFIHSFTSARGLEVQGAPYAAERDEPWPSGRFNHALFDMNRDWFALTQPETRGRVSAMLEWHPVVTVDAHEMGSSSTYFFAPGARPFTPFLTDDQLAQHEVIGKDIASAFDARGIPYFTREVYDMFYPGYGETWPGLNGAVGMTYEQASARGLRADRDDGTVLTYLDGIRNHFVATLTTASTVAENKDTFLGSFIERRASAVSEGRVSSRRFTVVDRAVRPGQADAFADRMEAQGIDVEVLPRGATACGKALPAGGYVVDRAQPNGRLISTLLDPNTPLAEDFMKEQEQRRKSGLRHQLYDVTAWSVPLMDGLSATACAQVDLSGALADGPPARSAALPDAAFGYALPWDDASQARLLIAALREGIVGRSTNEAFLQDGTRFPRGTVVFSRKTNGDDLGRRLGALVREHGGRLVAMHTSWVADGPNFGSRNFRKLTEPRVALAWGAGTSPLSAGAARYVIERQLGLPVTPIRVQSLRYAELDAYDVLVLPETRRGFEALLASGGGSIQRFAEDGGVVIGFGSAVSILADDAIGLLPARRERKALPEGQAGRNSGDDGSTVPGTELWSEEDYREAVTSGNAYPDSVPGVLVRAVADQNHWLSAGYEEAIALFRGNTIYSPLTDSEGTNVFRYRDAEELLASGYLWADVKAQMARKPFVMARNVGDGVVIGFAQDPTVRAYLNGLQLLVANGLLFGPAHTD